MSHPGITIGIVGGRGMMGAWFQRFFEEQGLRVLISGRTTALQPPEMARRCDIVMISVPIGITEEVIRQVGPHVREDSLLTDLTSLKILPVQAMLSHSAAEVIGMHPLFGPGLQSLKGQNVIVCPARGHRWQPWLQDILVRNGGRVHISTPEEHDRMMSIIQGLRYFCCISMAGALMTMKTRIQDCDHFSTPPFRIFMDVVGRLFAQDPTLTTDICVHNPMTMAAVRIFREWMGRWASLLERGDAEEFAALFREITTFLGDFCPEASAETDALIQTLTLLQSYNPVDFKPEVE